MLKANDVGSEQKPPAPHKYLCPLGMNGRIAPLDDAEVLYYPDDAPDCLHRPHVEPSWHAALVQHLRQYRRYPREIQSQGHSVLLGFTVDRSGHVLNREIVTVNDSPSREIWRKPNHTEFENEAISMIDCAQPLPPFPASMTEAKLDLIVPIYGRVEVMRPPTWIVPPGAPIPPGPSDDGYAIRVLTDRKLEQEIPTNVGSGHRIPMQGPPFEK